MKLIQKSNFRVQGMLFQQLYCITIALHLSLEIMCTHFILSGPHTSLHICNHIHYKKKLQYNFPKMRGGGWKAVWNSFENSSDLVAPPFPSLTMQNCIKFIHVDGVWKRTIVLFNWVWLEWEIVMQKSESDAKYSDSNSGSDCYAYLMAMALARHL